MQNSCQSQNSDFAEYCSKTWQRLQHFMQHLQQQLLHIKQCGCIIIKNVAVIILFFK